MFIPFDPYDLDNQPKQLQQLLDDNLNTIETLLTKERYTFENFIKPFEFLDEKLGLFFTQISHLNSVKNSTQTQEAYSACLPLLSQYESQVSQDVRIYEAFLYVKEHEWDVLNHTQRHLVDESLLAFKLSGAHLDSQQKKRLTQINLRLSELSNSFRQNVLDATNSFVLTIDSFDDVQGIPPSDLEHAKKVRDGKTIYEFTLQMPSYLAYMTYGVNRTHRETLYQAFTTRAPQNQAVIDEILSLRHERANILGFDSYAQLSVASKMVKSVPTVVEFLRTLKTQALPQGTKELEILKEFAQTTDGITLQSYDVAFYSEKLRKRDFDIDEEELRPYFEQNSVVNGLFEFLHKLLGISFIAANDVALWDEKAKAYDIYDKNERMARLFIDLEARSDKQGGAWMHNWQTHCIDTQGNEQLASAFVVCNFAPSSEQTPSLLRHDDVVTLFHEMGHALHHLLSRVNINSLSGVNGIEWDAVEFPSQFLENFAYEPEVLRMFALHYETHEVLPQTLIDKIVKAKNFQSAMMMLRQLEFSLFDILLHDRLYQGDEVQKLLDEVRQEMKMLTPPSYNKFQHGFSHIFGGGYAAGYYSYKYAEVLSADAFYYFKDNGIFNTQIAQAYKEHILYKGASQSMAVLFKEFIKRDIDTTALLRLSGINA